MDERNHPRIPININRKRGISQRRLSSLSIRASGLCIGDKGEPPLDVSAYLSTPVDSSTISFPLLLRSAEVIGRIGEHCSRGGSGMHTHEGKGKNWGWRARDRSDESTDGRGYYSTDGIEKRSRTTDQTVRFCSIFEFSEFSRR